MRKGWRLCFPPLPGVSVDPGGDRQLPQRRDWGVIVPLDVHPAGKGVGRQSTIQLNCWLLTPEVSPKVP